jgi:GTPase
MTDPTGDGERRLTAGERNEMRRQERRAARRATDGTAGKSGAAGRSGAAGKNGAGGAGRGSGSGRTGEAGATPRAGTSVDGGGAVSPRSHRDGAAVGGSPARTKRGSAVESHKAVSVKPAAGGVGAYRAGFACFVGRPNAGKSTLTNAIIGQKIAITSSKPQTTRHIIRGILHRANAQLVLVDTPGLHRPRTLLGERLNDLVMQAWSEVDVIGICFPANEPIGRGDRFIAAEMAELKATVLAVVTKVDLVDPATLAKHLVAVSELYDFAEIVPVSAVSGHQVDTLVDVMIKYLPESPQLYPDDVLTEEPEQVLIGELIREAALEGVRDELPHSIAVLVEEMIEEGDLTRIFADLYVERDSQKSIVIGTRGARLKDVGTKARAQIEALLGRRIYLDLHVRVAKEWQRDPKQLRKLGF